MTDHYPVDSPPQMLASVQPNMSVVAREKSAVREAITLVCDQGASRLQGWLDTIDDGTPGGAEKAMGMFLKLLEFSMPKLQRVTVQDPDGNAPKQPIINVTFAAPPTMKIVQGFEDIEPEPTIEDSADD